MPATSPNESRVRGYKEALAKHQVPFDAALVVGDSFSEQSGYIETKLLLKAQNTSAPAGSPQSSRDAPAPAASRFLSLTW